MEQWVHVLPNYEISSEGRLRKTLLGHLTEDGWKQFSLALGGRRYKLIRAADLVWEAFRGPIPKGAVVELIDGNEENTALSNLRLTTT